MNDDDPFLPVAEVARRTTLSPTTLHQWAAEAEDGLPSKGPKHFRIGRRRMWRSSDVDRWLAERKVG